MVYVKTQQICHFATGSGGLKQTNSYMQNHLQYANRRLTYCFVTLKYIRTVYSLLVEVWNMYVKTLQTMNNVQSYLSRITI